MKFISTKDAREDVGFKEAVLMGLPLTGGLFVPARIPQLDANFSSSIDALTIKEIAFHILTPFVEEDLSDAELRAIIDHTFQFDIPLKRIGNSNTHVLELFHGPTWAFKDVGARFLAGCLTQWIKPAVETVILVATSGDTGGAVANGFYGLKGTKVVVLYPEGKISPLQERQIAGLGGNITALAVKGTFDDCQQMVKQAFNDQALRSRVNITSANSINVARWLPQMIFYALAWREIQKQGIESTVCIPSGNYGNIAAAYLMHGMGLHFSKILAAHNANSTIPRFLKTGKYEPEKTIATLANAMDVSDPSNFVRLQYLLQQKNRSHLAYFNAASVSDKQILEVIKDVWNDHQYLLDPHTAAAWDMLKLDGGNGIIVATAHPYKFEDVIVKSLGYYPSEWKKAWKSDMVNSIRIPAQYESLKELIL